MAKSKKSCTSFTKSEINDLFKRVNPRLKYSGLRILTAPSLQDRPRLLIVTPRACGNSVQRNLFRRRIKELFKNHFIDKQCDMIIIIDKRAINLSFKNLMYHMERAVQATS